MNLIIPSVIYAASIPLIGYPLCRFVNSYWKSKYDWEPFDGKERPPAAIAAAIWPLIPIYGASLLVKPLGEKASVLGKAVAQAMPAETIKINPTALVLNTMNKDTDKLPFAVGTALLFLFRLAIGVIFIGLFFTYLSPLAGAFLWGAWLLVDVMISTKRITDWYKSVVPTHELRNLVYQQLHDMASGSMSTAIIKTFWGYVFIGAVYFGSAWAFDASMGHVVLSTLGAWVIGFPYSMWRLRQAVNVKEVIE